MMVNGGGRWAKLGSQIEQDNHSCWVIFKGCNLEVVDPSPLNTVLMDKDIKEAMSFLTDGVPVLVHSPSVDEVSMACSSTSVFQQHRRLFKMIDEKLHCFLKCCRDWEHSGAEQHREHCCKALSFCDSPILVLGA